MMQWKLKIAEQRLAPEWHRLAPCVRHERGERLGSSGPTPRNVEGSSKPGVCWTETALRGWGTRIRTQILGVRVRCSTIELSPTEVAEKTALFRRVLQSTEKN